MSSQAKSRDNRSARRFQLNVPVQMLSRISDAETSCASRDISHRGIFVYTEHPLPENSRIQFTMNLKTRGPLEEGVRVLCSGTVVRIEAPVRGNAGMAVTIDTYRFLHTEKANA